jgi:hypothetical protein
MEKQCAAYEVMRAAMDRRYGLWAIPLQVMPRLNIQQEEAIQLAKETVKTLLEEDMIILFKTPWAWGQEQILDKQQSYESLNENKNWKPKKISSRKLVRIGFTEKGKTAFLNGNVGIPCPIVNSQKHRLSEAVLAPLSTAEWVGIMLAALLGSSFAAITYWAVSFIQNDHYRLPLSTFATSASAIFGAAIGIMLARSIIVPKNEEEGNPKAVIPDAYMNGPTLNPFDENGDPRF